MVGLPPVDRERPAAKLLRQSAACRTEIGVSELEFGGGGGGDGKGDGFGGGAGVYTNLTRFKTSHLSSAWAWAELIMSSTNSRGSILSKIVVSTSISSTSSLSKLMGLSLELMLSLRLGRFGPPAESGEEDLSREERLRSRLGVVWLWHGVLCVRGGG